MFYFFLQKLRNAMLQKHYQLPSVNLFVLIIFFVIKDLKWQLNFFLFTCLQVLYRTKLSASIVLGAGILFNSASRVINIFIKKLMIINIVSNVILRVLCVNMQHISYTLKPDLNNNTKYIHYAHNKQYLRLSRNYIKSVNDHQIIETRRIMTVYTYFFYSNENNKCKRFTYKFCIVTIRKKPYR